MTEVLCDWCGRQLQRPPSRVRDTNFCGRSCHGSYRSVYLVGDRSAHWKGGVRMDRRRAMLLMPDHPSAHSNGYVYRYRVLAEQLLGRALKADEVVHHIDGDETNDALENLMVITQSQHAREYGAHRKASGVVPSHCGNGHQLSPENVYRYQRNGLAKWTCRVCQRERWRRHDERKKVAA